MATDEKNLKPNVPPASGSQSQDMKSGSDAATQTVTANAEAPKFYVDGRLVAEEEYFKAAEKAGFNPQRLREMNYRPAISLKRSGE
jgi:hypothetical protein